MINREQIRAKNALCAINKRQDLRGRAGGDAVSGYPALLVNNGLMATLAFGLSAGGGHESISHAIAEHLSDAELKMPIAFAKDAKSLTEQLSKETSVMLRLATAESLAYLNYLKRFVKSGLFAGEGRHAAGA